jgi:uncharacterized protein YbaA (DUF1428 family)
MDADRARHAARRARLRLSGDGPPPLFRHRPKRIYPRVSEPRRPARPVVGSHPPQETAMPYVDGFVLAVPKANLEAYKDVATLAGEVWMEHGALSYVECFADDVPYGELTSFPRAVQATDDEVVVFSWITYASREARDEINAKIMTDPRMQQSQSCMPFDGKRMIYGGFRSFVAL